MSPQSLLYMPPDLLHQAHVGRRGARRARRHGRSLRRIVLRVSILARRLLG